jgi:putative ABC transport system permease protein
VSTVSSSGRRAGVASLSTVSRPATSTLSTPFVAGRDFQTADAIDPRVAIVNQAMARDYFGVSNPLGRHFTFEGQARPLEIVGVVADAKYLDLHETPPRTAYTNALQGFGGTAPTFLLRSDVPPLSIVPDVRRAVEGRAAERAAARSDAARAARRVHSPRAVDRHAVRAVWRAGGRPRGDRTVRLLHGRTPHERDRNPYRAWRDELRHRPDGGRRCVAAGRRRLRGGAPIALVAKVYAGKVLTLVAATQAQAPITLPASAAWPIVGAAGAMIAVALIASCIPARRATKVDPIEALRRIAFQPLEGWACHSAKDRFVNRSVEGRH